jgi:multidrug efflux pump subunit AcrA (membrane-fusion protein)
MTGLVGCSGARSADSEGAEGLSGSDRTAGPRDGKLILTGELQAVESADTGTPPSRSWPITISWMLPEGTQVQAGQEILQFDNSVVLTSLKEQEHVAQETSIKLRSREPQLEVERAESSFAVERARLELEKARLEASVPLEMRTERESEEKKLALERAVAELAKAERDLEAFEVGARADLDVLRRELTKAEREIASARRALESFSVKAPREGILIYGEHPWQRRKFEIGDPVWPAMTVLKIPDLTRMEVIAWLSDLDDGAVSIGQPVRCILDTYPDREFTGTVSDVASIAAERPRSSRVRVFQVVVDLDQSDSSIMRPGMSVKVEMRERLQPRR